MMENQLLLLGLLRQQDMHGYQLYEFIERDLATCTDLKKPTAYYLLNKLAQVGLVTEEVSQEGNRPPRRVYHLTPQGEAGFQQLLRDSLSSFTPAYFPGDIGLAFLDAMPPEEALTLLRLRRASIEQALAEAMIVPDHAGSIQIAIERRRHYLRAEMEWLDQVITRLNPAPRTADSE
jgi:DNA-binding PadR family transcriptional regulator